MSAETTETPIERAKREAEAAQVEAELARKPAQPPEMRHVQIVLDVDFSAGGVAVRVHGCCNGRLVLDASDNSGVPIGYAAKETLRLGALGALLGR